MDLEKTVEKVISIWRENEKNIEKKISIRIKGLNKINSGKKAGKLLHVREPLKAYINASNSITLRFCGQIVAGLSVKNDVPKLHIDKKQAENNNKSFSLGTQECNVNWDSNEATAFRRKFLSLEKNPKKCNKIHSPEHQVETNLIKAMNGSGKKSNPKGTILGYRQVLLFGLPFQMPMPISGSSGEPKYTNRGHIDILARTGGGKGRMLSVWELKKPKISCRELEKAMQQVVIYATTLILILRSKFAEDWYNFFKFTSNLPNKLKVEAVVVVSESRPQQHDNFKKKVKEFTTELKVEKDTIIPRVAYYNENNYKIEKIVSCR